MLHVQSVLRLKVNEPWGKLPPIHLRSISKIISIWVGQFRKKQFELLGACSNQLLMSNALLHCIRRILFNLGIGLYPGYPCCTIQWFQAVTFNIYCLYQKIIIKQTLSHLKYIISQQEENMFVLFAIIPHKNPES